MYYDKAAALYGSAKEKDASSFSLGTVGRSIARRSVQGWRELENTEAIEKVCEQ